jgi:hypothetical protein
MNNVHGWTGLNLADIRRPALFSFVSSSLLQALKVYSTEMNVMRSGMDASVQRWLMVGSIVVVCLIAPIMPLFYLGLYWS